MKRKLNIAMICDSVTSVTGGSFASTLRFSDLLSKKGHKIIIISSSQKGKPAIDYHNKIKIYRLPSLIIPKTDKKLYLSIPSKKKIKQIIQEEKIDIVHVTMPFPQSSRAIKAARHLSVPVITHSHVQSENWEVYLPTKLRTSLVNKVFNKILVSFHNKADKIICPSKFSERLLQKNGINKPTVVISNGVNTLKFKKVPFSKADLKKHNLSETSKKVLFVGRLDPEKNIEVLIKAASVIKKEYPNFEICIVGGGKLKEHLEKLAANLDIKENIKFLGKISDEDLIKAYNFCDFFVLPSLIELESMVVLEAMSCGKPVIIADSDQSAASQFVEDNGFLFNPLVPEDLAEKCLSILKNKNLLKKMSKNSYKISRRYDINKSVSKLEKEYYSLIEKELPN